MRAWLAGFSDRAEFVLVVVVCFTYYTSTSLYVLLTGMRQFDLTTGRAARGIAVELVLLAILAIILRARGTWTLDRLGLRFSWAGALSGIPLFVLYLLLYWMTATIVLMLWPAARTVWTFRYTISAPAALMTAFIIVNSLFEEIAVTAYVVSALEKQGAALAITASTLLRFGYHLYQGPLASLSVLPLGLVFGAMFWRWRNVWPLVVAHTIANIAAFLLTPR